MYKTISFCEEIKENCPNIRLGIINCSVLYSEQTQELWERIDATCKDIESKYEIVDVKNIATIGESKKAYKKLGKDPNRYRLSAEALMRRIINGKSLYKINNLVDIVNLSSIDSGFSIGAYNVENVKGDIVLAKGKKNDFYVGIGRGELNIENLPVLRDDNSAFGSPTSDSPRTQLDKDTENMMLVFFDFDSNSELEKAMSNSKELLLEYAGASDISVRIFE